MTECQNALYNVQKSCFALLDCGLFLDTHPKCSNALSYFERMKPEAEKAEKMYEEHFGPLRNTSAGGSDWNWITGPWPWEGVK